MPLGDAGARKGVALRDNALTTAQRPPLVAAVRRAQSPRLRWLAGPHRTVRLDVTVLRFAPSAARARQLQPRAEKPAALP